MPIDVTQTFWVTNFNDQPEMGIDPQTGDVIWTPVGIKFWKPILRNHGLNIAKINNLNQFLNVFRNVNAAQADWVVERVRQKCIGKGVVAIESRALYALMTTNTTAEVVIREMNAGLRRLDIRLVESDR
jgi:hypothetical protein